MRKLSVPQKHGLESITQEEHIFVSDFVAAGVSCTVFRKVVPQYFRTLKKGSLAYF